MKIFINLFFCLIFELSEVTAERTTLYLNVLNNTSNPKDIEIKDLNNVVIKTLNISGKSSSISFNSDADKKCVRLFCENKRPVTIFLESNVDISVSLSNDMELKVTGGYLNELYENSQSQIISYLRELYSADSKHGKEKIADEIYIFFKEILNKNELFGSVFLMENISIVKHFKPELTYLKKHDSLLTIIPKNLSNYFYPELKSMLDSLIRLTPGGAIFDFELKNFNSKLVSTIDKRGKNLLLFFSGRDCIGVSEHKQTLLSNFSTLQKLNVEILEISTDYLQFPYSSSLLDIERELQVGSLWDVLYLFNDSYSKKVLDNYNVLMKPRSYLYSEKGVFLSYNPSLPEILNVLNSNKKK